MTNRKKLEQLIDHFADGDITVFAETLQVPRSTVTTWLFRGAITAKGCERILDAFPIVSREWLIHDGPAMLTAHKPTIEIDRSNAVPFYEELNGTCGVAEQFEHPEFATDYIHIPGVRALAALPAKGDSMEPTIMDGDTVLVADAMPVSNYSRDNIYLVITTEGQRMFKRLEEDSTSKRHILAVSDNPFYSPRVFRLERRDIIAIFPVKSVVRNI